MIAFIKAIFKKLSIFIAIYFLSTIVADQMASAILLWLTKAFPVYFLARPRVLIVESFGQAAAALTAHGLDKSTYENKLVFLMGVEKARFRNPVIPDCKLILKIEAIRSHGRVWKYKGEAYVDQIKMADAVWSATIVDKK